MTTEISIVLKIPTDKRDIFNYSKKNGLLATQLNKIYVSLMRTGWFAYFQWFPDYKIEITDLLLHGDIGAAFGFASGTFQGLSDRKENYWRLPAVWKAITKNGKISLWQVYADSKIPYDIINKSKKHDKLIIEQGHHATPE